MSVVSPVSVVLTFTFYRYFFFVRFGVCCAGVFGEGMGVFLKSSLRKRLKLALALLKFRRRAVGRAAILGGVRRKGRGGVSKGVTALLFRFGVWVRRGRGGAFGVFFGMGWFFGVSRPLFAMIYYTHIK